MGWALRETAELMLRPSLCVCPPTRAPGIHTCGFPREILGGVSYKGSRKNVKHMPLYCETCHLSGSSGNGAQQGFVPRGPHVALSRCWDIMDFSSRRLLTLAQALRTSCSLIRLREQRPGVVVGPSPGPHHKRGGRFGVNNGGFCGHGFFRNGRGITNAPALEGTDMHVGSPLRGMNKIAECCLLFLLLIPYQTLR